MGLLGLAAWAVNVAVSLIPTVKVNKPKFRISILNNRDVRKFN